MSTSIINTFMASAERGDLAEFTRLFTLLQETPQIFLDDRRLFDQEPFYLAIESGNDDLAKYVLDNCHLVHDLTADSHSVSSRYATYRMWFDACVRAGVRPIIKEGINYMTSRYYSLRVMISSDNFHIAQEYCDNVWHLSRDNELAELHKYALEEGRPHIARSIQSEIEKRRSYSLSK
jgi:hypothetical protein